MKSKFFEENDDETIIDEERRSFTDGSKAKIVTKMIMMSFW